MFSTFCVCRVFLCVSLSVCPSYIYIHPHCHLYVYKEYLRLDSGLLISACLLLLISMLWHRQSIFESKGDKSSSSAEYRIWSWEVSDTNSPADWMPTHKPTELSRIKLKTWTQQPVPMMSKHSAHLTSLPIGFRTWLWHYTCVICTFYIYADHKEPSNWGDFSVAVRC